MFRGFARLETGVIPGLGGKAHIAYAASAIGKFRGNGPQEYKQVDFRFEQPLPLGVLSGFYDWSERRETDYQDLSLDSEAAISRLGYQWDNRASDWDLAQHMADVANNIDLNNDGRSDLTGSVPTNPRGTDFPAPITTLDDAYYDASGLRDDQLARLTWDADLTDTFSVSLTTYLHETRRRRRLVDAL